MTEPLSDEEKARLVADYASGNVAKSNAELFAKPRKQKPTEFSRPPIVVKSGGVQQPKGWFGAGRVDKGAEEAKF